MGFSPHASQRAWFNLACRRRVLGVSLALRVTNETKRRIKWVRHLVLRVLQARNTLKQPPVWVAVPLFSLSPTNQKRTKNNRIMDYSFQLPLGFNDNFQVKMPKPIMSLVIFLLVLWQSTVTFAGPPLLPAAFYGNIILNNQSSPPIDMIVVAAIDEIEYARGAVFQNEGEWVYAIKVPADDPSTEAIDGGRPGDMVTFSINGETLGEAPWQGGSNTQVDLSLSPEQAEPSPSDTNNSPSWLPWLLVVVALLLFGATWFLFIRPRLRKT